MAMCLFHFPSPRAQVEKSEEALRAELKSPFGEELTVGRGGPGRPGGAPGWQDRQG
jgi:hypothetical protein